MSAYPYASDAKIAEALTALGADAIAPNEQTLLQQLVVAAATSGGGGSSNALLLAGASSSDLTGLTAATASTGGLFYGTQAGADRKFTMTAAGAALAEAADATAQKTALALGNVQPLILSFKNITLLTTGAPADIATITVPSWCTRYVVILSGSRILAETAAGTLAAASITVRTAANGAGDPVTGTTACPASTASTVSVTGTSVSVAPPTTQTLYVYQTGNSANAGTVSGYLILVPLL